MRARPSILLLTCGLGFAQVAPAETRAPLPSEIKSFDAYYRQVGAQGAGPAVFEIQRASRSAAWTVAAAVDAPWYRSTAGLCRMTRSRFVAEGGSRWAATLPAQQFIKRAGGAGGVAGCASRAEPVALRQAMPDVAIVPLLDQRGPLLARARLLMAGNTLCSSQRAYAFKLEAIDVSAPTAGQEEMVDLIYRSDRATAVHVWVKQSGAELTAWNAACPPS